MESLIERMQSCQGGIPVRTAKHFLTKIPTCFTGAAFVEWLVTNLDVTDHNELMHLAHLISSHGYVFPIDDHVLTVKNDFTYYRFQTPFLWPSNNWQPDDYDYAVYLCKRTMQNKQRLELADHEAQALARLQKTFSRKWEFIYLQAEAQAKVDRRRDRIERKVLDSQEQAFWDLHRPAPGCVNTTEEDLKKTQRCMKDLLYPLSILFHYIVTLAFLSKLLSQIEKFQGLLQRRRVKVSKVSECYMSFSEQYSEYDPFVTTSHPPNPWISDSTDFWQLQDSNFEIPAWRINRWSFGLHELLKDPAGREHFRLFLQKEFSAENLKFWEACERLKKISLKEVKSAVLEIYNDHLGKMSTDPVNLDGRVLESVKKNVESDPSNRYCLDEAQDHIFLLMKRDSYNRFIRLDLHKEFCKSSRKKGRNVATFPDPMLKYSSNFH
ncbi:hypothetical protein HELRODRAFT_155898 [Helobdella robusta]|uniref:RGS domain-containing protein n=1 Tax=Helobdella robusta TaxID=6412 RepID=T1ELN9_HELRO|nr:hypothetical protein HELRODRAFT_155898 [Helobdella robusta]ESN98782.1 hypothetical protein HELRODRAFT_155898 [Helobdella robusta]